MMILSATTRKLLVRRARWSSLRRGGRDSAAAMCQTSGTTGNPKGVVDSHRSSVLHAWARCSPTRSRSPRPT